MLAAYGYAVVSANPRGSTGYGTAFSRAIWADWGNKDFEDVMAAVDAVVATGVADPEPARRRRLELRRHPDRLRDHQDRRASRPRSPAPASPTILAGYGTDHYQYHYEVELGLPWKDRERWLAAVARPSSTSRR